MKARILFIAASVAVLAGCPDDDDDYYRYDVSVTNLTPNQPMSPLAVLTHNTILTCLKLGKVPLSILNT